MNERTAKLIRKFAGLYGFGARDMYRDWSKMTARAKARLRRKMERACAGKKAPEQTSRGLPVRIEVGAPSMRVTK